MLSESCTEDLRSQNCIGGLATALATDLIAVHDLGFHKHVQLCCDLCVLGVSLGRGLEQLEPGAGKGQEGGRVRLELFEALNHVILL